MLKPDVIESAIALMATKQGHSLNSADMLEIRSRVAGSLAQTHSPQIVPPF